MAFIGNTQNNPDAATLDFWRAVEASQISEVEALLPRVADINVRNEHGVTALMRAAQHGHARVVRLLLAHGADANLVRNDKFTALSLAAFFGHTEV
ncbi:MAG TPA: ankyrin repeat domain-containing protein, partial [Pyrinomonadaceae bacterium]